MDMRFPSKLFLPAGAPSTMMCTIGWYEARARERALLGVIQRAPTTRADASMRGLRHMTSVRPSAWKRFAQAFPLRSTLEASNAEFEPAMNRKEWIDERDSPWRAHSESQLFDRIRERSTSELSHEHQAFALHPDPGPNDLAFPEVLTTNRFGATLAFTNTASDYYHDGKKWAEATEHGGYLNPLQNDGSFGAFSIAFCMRVEAPSGEPLGVLRATLDQSAIFDTVQDRAGPRESESGVITQLDEHGRVPLTASERVHPKGDMPYPNPITHVSALAMARPLLITSCCA